MLVTVKILLAATIYAVAMIYVAKFCAFNNTPPRDENPKVPVRLDSEMPTSILNGQD